MKQLAVTSAAQQRQQELLKQVGWTSGSSERLCCPLLMPNLVMYPGVGRVKGFRF